MHIYGKLKGIKVEEFTCENRFENFFQNLSMIVVFGFKLTWNNHNPLTSNFCCKNRSQNLSHVFSHRLSEIFIIKLKNLSDYHLRVSNIILCQFRKRFRCFQLLNISFKYLSKDKQCLTGHNPQHIRLLSHNPLKAHFDGLLHLLPRVHQILLKQAFQQQQTHLPDLKLLERFLEQLLHHSEELTRDSKRKRLNLLLV